MRLLLYTTKLILLLSKNTWNENMAPSKLMSRTLFIYFFTNFVVIMNCVGSIVSHESPSAEMSFSRPIFFYSSLESYRHHILKKRENIILTKNNYNKADDEEMMMGENQRIGRKVLSANVHQVKQQRRGRISEVDDFDLKNQEEKEETGFKSSSKSHPVILSSSPSSSFSFCPGPILSLPPQQSKSFQKFAPSAKTYLSSSPSRSSSSLESLSLGSSEFHGLQNILKNKKRNQKISFSLDEDEHGQRPLKTQIRHTTPFIEETSNLEQGDRATRHDVHDEDQDNIPPSGSEESDILKRLKSFEVEKRKEDGWNFEDFFMPPQSGSSSSMVNEEKIRRKKNKSITASSRRSRILRSNLRLLSRKKRFFLSGTFQLPSLFLEVLSMMRKS